MIASRRSLLLYLLVEGSDGEVVDLVGFGVTNPQRKRKSFWLPYRLIT